MITSMYGHCDAFDVVYTQIGKDQWQATVPPDLTDGKYVVDIYGVDNTGFLVYWAGILYMYDSRLKDRAAAGQLRYILHGCR